MRFCFNVYIIKKSNKKELTSSHLMNFSPSSKALGTSIGLSVMLADLELVDIVNNKHNYAETITPANIKTVIFLPDHKINLSTKSIDGTHSKGTPYKRKQITKRY